MGAIFDDKKFRYSPLNIAGSFEFDAVDENVAVAGYTNTVAFVELADRASVDSETALYDAAINTFPFEAYLFGFLRHASLAFRPNISDTVEFGRELIVPAAAERAVREIGLQNQVCCSAIRAVILAYIGRTLSAAGYQQAE